MTAPEVTRTTCTACAAPSGGGRFCTACGAALSTPPTALETLQAWTRSPAVPSQPTPEDEPAAAPSWGGGATTPPPWLSPEPAPPVRRGGRNVLAGLVVVALLVSGWALVRGVEQHTLTGTVSLVDSDSSGSEPGEECFGEDGYDDLNAGARVLVADEDGTTLATGRLSAGEYDGLACVFSFTLEDVTRAEFYAVRVAGENRGEMTYSYDELADDDWSVELSLGDD